MKRETLNLFLAVGLVLSCGTFSGCKSSPNQIAYTTTAATVATVDSAMQAWAQYVVTERARIQALKPIDQGSQAADLLRAEGKVREAFGAYQSAMAAANLSLAVGDTSTAPPEVAKAAAQLLGAIQTITHK